MANYSLFDMLLDGVIIVDKQLKVVYCNQAAAALAGINIRRIKRGTSLDQVFTFSPDLLKGGIEAIVSATPYREVKFISKAKVEGHVRFCVQPEVAGSDENAQWVIFLRDTSLEVNLEKKYKKERAEKSVVIQVVQQDMLTKLYNRFLFLKLLTDACERAVVKKEFFSLLLIDIDGFKAINEKYGPEGADSLLIGFSKLISQNFNSTKYPAGRLAGDLFGIVLLGHKEHAALEVARAFQRTMRGNVFDLKNGKTVTITVSISIAEFYYEKNGKALFERAARAMAEAKRKTSKNRVAISQTA